MENEETGVKTWSGTEAVPVTTLERARSWLIRAAPADASAPHLQRMSSRSSLGGRTSITGRASLGTAGNGDIRHWGIGFGPPEPTAAAASLDKDAVDAANDASLGLASSRPRAPLLRLASGGVGLSAFAAEPLPEEESVTHSSRPPPPRVGTIPGDVNITPRTAQRGRSLAFFSKGPARTPAKGGKSASDDTPESGQHAAMVVGVGEPPLVLWRRRINEFMENRWLNAFLSLLIVWALIGTDIKFALTSYATDFYFDGVTILLFSVFVTEWLLNIAARPHYFLSFFFFVDIASAVTLLFDIPAVLATLTGGTIQGNTSTAVRAARASQLGTRAARIVGMLYRPAWVARLMDSVVSKVVVINRFRSFIAGTSHRKSTASAISSQPSEPPSGRPSAVPPSKFPSRRSSGRALLPLDSPPPLPPSLTLGTSSSRLSLSRGDSEDLSPSTPSMHGLQLYTGPTGGIGGSSHRGSVENGDDGRSLVDANAANGPPSPALPSRHSGRASLNLAMRRRTRASPAGGAAAPVEDERAETRVGATLSTLITIRTVVLVLLMLFIIPAFALSFYAVDSASVTAVGGLRMLHHAWVGAGANSTVASTLLTDYLNSAGDTSPVTGFVYWLVINGTTLLDGAAHYATLRPQREVLISSYQTSLVHVDTRGASRLQAVCDLCKSIFIIIILGGGALLFAKDANDLVLAPIERLVRLMRRMAANPLAKQPVEERDAGEQYETGALRTLFSKMLGLLQLGFGEAGAQVIANNLRRGGALQPMVPGKKCVAIFGFCDIRQFTDTTECLQEEVMEYVNSIAKIVHTETALHGGSANKNIGDAFLLVWKFPEGVTLDDVEKAIEYKGGDIRDSLTGSEGDLTDREIRRDVNRVADKALAAFVAIQVRLLRSLRLQKFASDTRVRERLPDFSVTMGFGLHVGWAIEGAIGSEYKVDASYLSPNVNMASRLEAATKQFGVPLLLSDDFAAILSPAVRQRCRPIDCVTVKGSELPVVLYTMDLDLTTTPSVPPGTEEETLSNADFVDSFRQHPDLCHVVGAAGSPEFYARFNEGLLSYLDGDWETARDCLFDCIDMRTDSHGAIVKDGPAATLLNVMRQHNFRAPLEWTGHRELTEK